jgi:hypothetical protein
MPFPLGQATTFITVSDIATIEASERQLRKSKSAHNDTSRAVDCFLFVPMALFSSLLVDNDEIYHDLMQVGELLMQI